MPRKKARAAAVPVDSEEAEIDRIVDERETPSKQYLCTWMDGGEPQWVDAEYLEGLPALEDWEDAEYAEPEEEASAAEVAEAARQIVSMLRTAKRPVFLTGAGLSAPVLPTFRGAKGLWTKNAVSVRQTHSSGHLRPTDAHLAITALERWGSSGLGNSRKPFEKPMVYWCVTQNYDDLHRRSGFPVEKLSELHGNIFKESCDTCGICYHRPFEVEKEDAVDHETGRTCEDEACPGLLRDNIVHFGEGLPWSAITLANAKCKGSDLCIVLGSSLQVEPAASLPFKNKKKAVIVNLQHLMCRIAHEILGDGWLELVREELEIVPNKGNLTTARKSAARSDTKRSKPTATKTKTKMKKTANTTKKTVDEHRGGTKRKAATTLPPKKRAKR